MKITYLMVLFMLLQITVVSSQTKYTYPVQPGTSEWKKFKSTAEMINACQLPDDIVRNSTTEELLEICLNYPLIDNYVANNSYYEGFNNIVLGFNGLKEFFSRDNAHSVLLKYYLAEDLTNIEKLNADILKGKFVYRITTLELMLANTSIINKLSQTEKTAALKGLETKYALKGKYADYFGYTGKASIAFLGNKILPDLGKQKETVNSALESFLTRMTYLDEKSMDSLINKLFAK
ncbi:hypothetical protein J7E50_22470 [Pedobacter sp. ISL-68]|uniref:hypothetical protein n=1 Tax=unclassified Pedobacter TaxID=2628915 RepID=UPI001BE63936|nr:MULTISPECIES: hypothetical protein [unclassified Pedobacter]MBT2562997.1 hypothetical protein [Pedobacter sp. ISL-64]MBT2593001.1 hypothetical protein [Pedobacter sp. ISL-68]